MKSVSPLMVTLAVVAWAAPCRLAAQTEIIPLPTYRVWAAARTVYAQLRIPVTVFQVAQYRVGNRGYRVRRLGGERPSQFLDCGTGANGVRLADESDVRLTVVTTLEPRGPDSTAISTEVSATREPGDAGGEMVRCTSNGNLERQIADFLHTAPEPGAPVVLPTGALELSGTLGFVRMRGAIGHPRSDQGLSVRLGAHWKAGKYSRWGLEVAAVRLNQFGDSTNGTCLTAEELATFCRITSRTRDVGGALVTTARLGAHGSGRPAPYAVVGAGILFVRSATRIEGRDPSGNSVTPVITVNRYDNLTLTVPLGVGLDLPLRASRLSARVEARMNWTLVDRRTGWSPLVEVGATWVLGER